MPTFVPGWNSVPLCRTIMFPARHRCPPYNLIPRNLGFESLLFWVDPPCFFVARRICSRQQGKAFKDPSAYKIRCKRHGLFLIVLLNIYSNAIVCLFFLLCVYIHHHGIAGQRREEIGVAKGKRDDKWIWKSTTQLRRGHAHLQSSSIIYYSNLHGFVGERNGRLRAFATPSHCRIPSVPTPLSLSIT